MIVLKPKFEIFFRKYSTIDISKVPLEYTYENTPLSTLILSVIDDIYYYKINDSLKYDLIRNTVMPFINSIDKCLKKIKQIDKFIEYWMLYYKFDPDTNNCHYKSYFQYSPYTNNVIKDKKTHLIITLNFICYRILQWKKIFDTNNPISIFADIIADCCYKFLGYKDEQFVMLQTLTLLI